MVVLNTKKMAIVIAALVGAGINVDTLISYLIDLVTGGPKHDWGNAIATEIRGVVDRMIEDPIGWSMGVALDVTLIYAAFGLLSMIIKAAGGKKSVQIAKGVTWRFA